MPFQWFSIKVKCLKHCRFLLLPCSELYSPYTQSVSPWIYGFNKKQQVSRLQRTRIKNHFILLWPTLKKKEKREVNIKLSHTSQMNSLCLGKLWFPWFVQRERRSVSSVALKAKQKRRHQILFPQGLMSHEKTFDAWEMLHTNILLLVGVSHCCEFNSSTTHNFADDHRALEWPFWAE